MENNALTTPLFSVHAIKNTRAKMEDAHVVIPDLNAEMGLQSDVKYSYYAIFDGHAGDNAAKYAAERLHRYLVGSPFFSQNDIRSAIIHAFALTDTNFMEGTLDTNIKSGCTAVVSLFEENLISKQRRLYLAWLGDSVALLVKNGRPHFSMNPHKADREDERQRIEDMGGTVLAVDTWRVNGILAVSRAIGDPEYKPYVISTPDIEIFDLDGTEDFLIIGCDGLWDQMTPDHACTIVYQELAENANDDDPTQVADRIVKQLIEAAKNDGSTDNITVIVLFLRDIKDIVKSIPFPPSTEKLSRLTDSIEEKFSSNGDYDSQIENDRRHQPFPIDMNGRSEEMSAINNKNGLEDNNNHDYDERMYSQFDTQADFLVTEVYQADKPKQDSNHIETNQQPLSPALHATIQPSEVFINNPLSDHGMLQSDAHSNLNPFAKEFEPQSILPEAQAISAVDGTANSEIIGSNMQFDSIAMNKYDSEDVTKSSDDENYSPNYKMSDDKFSPNLLPSDPIQVKADIEETPVTKPDLSTVSVVVDQINFDDQFFTSPTMPFKSPVEHSDLDFVEYPNQPESIVNFAAPNEELTVEEANQLEFSYMDTSGSNSTQFYSFMKENDLPPVSPISKDNPFTSESAIPGPGPFEEQSMPKPQNFDKNVFDSNFKDDFAQPENLLSEKITLKIEGEDGGSCEQVITQSAIVDTLTCDSVTENSDKVETSKHLNLIDEMSPNVSDSQPCEGLINKENQFIVEAETKTEATLLLYAESHELQQHQNEHLKEQNEESQKDVQFNSQFETVTSTDSLILHQQYSHENQSYQVETYDNPSTELPIYPSNGVNDERHLVDSTSDPRKLGDSSPESSLSPNPPPSRELYEEIVNKENSQTVPENHVQNNAGSDVNEETLLKIEAPQTESNEAALPLSPIQKLPSTVPISAPQPSSKSLVSKALVKPDAKAKRSSIGTVSSTPKPNATAKTSPSKVTTGTAAGKTASTITTKKPLSALSSRSATTAVKSTISTTKSIPSKVSSSVTRTTATVSKVQSSLPRSSVSTTRVTSHLSTTTAKPSFASRQNVTSNLQNGKAPSTLQTSTTGASAARKTNSGISRPTSTISSSAAKPSGISRSTAGVSASSTSKASTSSVTSRLIGTTSRIASKTTTTTSVPKTSTSSTIKASRASTGSIRPTPLSNSNKPSTASSIASRTNATSRPTSTRLSLGASSTFAASKARPTSLPGTRSAATSSALKTDASNKAKPVPTTKRLLGSKPASSSTKPNSANLVDKNNASQCLKENDNSSNLADSVSKNNEEGDKSCIKEKPVSVTSSSLGKRSLPTNSLRDELEAALANPPRENGLINNQETSEIDQTTVEIE